MRVTQIKVQVDEVRCGEYRAEVEVVWLDGDGEEHSAYRWIRTDTADDAMAWAAHVAKRLMGADDE